jgi:hypothetical protein
VQGPSGGFVAEVLVGLNGEAGALEEPAQGDGAPQGFLDLLRRVWPGEVIREGIGEGAADQVAGACCCAFVRVEAVRWACP